MSSDLSDLSLGEDETERAIERANSEEQHLAFVAHAPRADVAVEDKAQQQRVDQFMQRWSMPPQQAERAGERREFVVRAARLEIGDDAIERAKRPKQELTPEQREMQERIASNLLWEFSREVAALGTHLGVRLFDDEDTQSLGRFMERVFDTAAPTWLAERARTGQKLLGGEAFGELFKKKDPRTYRMMTEGWNPTFLPSSSMEDRNGASAKLETDEDKVIIRKRTPAKPVVGPLESDSTDEELVALEASGASRHTTVHVVPPELAKAPEPAGPPAEGENKGETGRLVAVGVIAAAVVGGACVWWFGIRNPTTTPGPAPTTTVTTTQVVTVVKTVTLPASATTTSAALDATTGGAPSIAPPPSVTVPPASTGAAPLPSMKSTTPPFGTTPTAPATPTTSAPPPPSGSHTPKFGGQ